MAQVIDLARIRQAAEATSVKALARRAGVPPTTVHSLAQRGWRYAKTLDRLASLTEAADAILAEQPRPSNWRKWVDRAGLR